MRLVVRADAGHAVGAGHLVRCRSIAARLGFAPERTLLVTAALPAGLDDAVRSWGWAVTEIGHLDRSADAVATAAALTAADDPGVLLVDHYGLDAEWERALSSSTDMRIAIDDLADRRHECEVLIDPSIDAPGRAHATAPGTPAPLCLLGPRFAPLDPSYDAVHPKPRDGRVHDLLVFLGGATRGAELHPLLDALRDTGLDIDRTTVVLGLAFPDREEVHARAGAVSGITVLDSVDTMLPLLESADLAVGAPGGAQWERCAAGLPSLTVLTHPNQVRDCTAFEKAGATRHLGALRDMTTATWHQALESMTNRPDVLTAMGAAAARLVSGRGQAWADARATVASRLAGDNGGAR